MTQLLSLESEPCPENWSLIKALDGFALESQNPCRGAHQLWFIAGLLFRSWHAPISMRICAGLASAKLTLLSRLGATNGATNSQGLFLLGFHGYMMHRCSATGWSIVTSTLTSECSPGGKLQTRISPCCRPQCHPRHIWSILTSPQAHFR
jgi:hypothetical protein